jgi:hypothetical protein
MRRNFGSVQPILDNTTNSNVLKHYVALHMLKSEQHIVLKIYFLRIFDILFIWAQGRVENISIIAYKHRKLRFRVFQKRPKLFYHMQVW